MSVVPPPPDYSPPPDLPIAILHEDEQLIIADKPGGLLAVPGRGRQHADCLQARLAARFGDLMAAHRLDMDTSGLIVFARNADALKTLSRQFEDREVDKTYIARVAGRLAHEAGDIDLPIGRIWAERPRRRIDTQSGQPSRTRWRLLNAEDASSLIELRPETGRTHQLRVHCAAIGHPILGDRLYGDVSSASRLCLHASQIGLTHPLTGRRIDVRSAPTFD